MRKNIGHHGAYLAAAFFLGCCADELDMREEADTPDPETPALLEFALKEGGGNPRAECMADCLDACSEAGKTAAQCKCNTRCGATGAPAPAPSSPAPASGPALPIYGNYCGPGYGDPTGLTPPIDAVDAACRAHDLCYDATNYFNCGCDRALLNALPAAIARVSAAGAAAGTAIVAHFSGSPCVCWLPCFVVPQPFCNGIGGYGAAC